MHIVVSNFGTFLGKKSERLLLKENGKVVEEKPFRDIEQITITSRGVSLSTDVIRECSDYGIQINLLTFSGKPYAKFTSPNLTGTVITRREQILAYQDQRSVLLSKAFVEGKLKNQANTLKYFAKYRKSSDMEKFRLIQQKVGEIDRIRGELSSLDGEFVSEVRGKLLAIEGRAAQSYWEGLSLLIGERVKFDGRERRGAVDPVNSALNYGYGVLYSQVWGAVTLAGLDPFAGFLHTDRPGKPSLVLDMVEEFRPVVVDRVVVAMVNKGIPIAMEGDKLTDKTRRDLVQRVMVRLDNVEMVDGKKYKLKAIIQKQARRVAGFVRGEVKYKPFVGSW